jgi:hypothetical protein
LQADKGVSSVRLAEALGVSQPTAWRIGHPVRLLMTREQQFGGTVEIDEFYIGGSPRNDADGRAWGGAAKASRGQLKHLSSPSSKGRKSWSKARRPARSGRGSSMIRLREKPVGRTILNSTCSDPMLLVPVHVSTSCPRFR